MNSLSKQFWNHTAVRTGAVLALAAAGATSAYAQSDADKAFCESLQGSAKIVCQRDLKANAAAPAPAPAPAAAAMPAATTAAPAATAATKAAAAGATPVASTGAGGAPLYKVVDGTKVDPDTLQGFHTWRQAACDRCHGANQEGMVGPSLIESLKVLSKQDFVTTITNGRPEKGMPSWSNNPGVMNNIDHLYAYLKGRSDGAITKAKVEAIQ